MFSIKALATVSAVNGWCNGMKWLNLLNLSTTTRMAVAKPDLGRPSTISIETISQEAEGTDRGWSNPGYLDLSGLACWQKEQD
jgi:hypothetical protein